MTTFEVGKTYYFNYYNIEKYEVVKKTKCYVFLINRQRGETFQKKILYNELTNEEFIIFRKDGMIKERRLYAYCKWNRYWKIGKDEEGNETIIKPDYKQYYKMNTATLKMFKSIIPLQYMYCRMILHLSLNDIKYDPEVFGLLEYEKIIKKMVEDNPEDFDKDYYCLYYTSNKDINWDVINKLMFNTYFIKEEIANKNIGGRRAVINNDTICREIK